MILEKILWSIPRYRAALIASPIREAQVVGSYAGVTCANCGGGQRGSSAAITMRDDVVAGLKTGLGQQLLQLMRWPSSNWLWAR